MAEGLDDETSRALVRLLERGTLFQSAARVRVWREQLNGRFVVFLSYGDQTYCLLPLSYSPVARANDAPSDS